MRRHRKKLIFEGPGNDPFLVLPGADVAAAAEDAVRGGYYNAGQACTSPERFYVHQDLLDAFVAGVLAATRREVVGEPQRPEVTIGPIVGRHIARRIHEHLDEARQLGAQVLAGGGVTQGVLRDGTPVTYVEPTVLLGVDGRMKVMSEETFGPVIAIQAVASAAEALHLAGDSSYGLAANLYGGDDGAAAVLQDSHGQVFRNEIWLDYFRRNLHAPYGGRKRSGWVWAWEGGSFVRRDGVRTNSLEFSRGPASGPAPL